ncbi:BQ2448_5285 [Microbotryum intermedium]|uniref:BQ2448_5285 protein n=1 Tax=Microbotryum intermedium TaxID=269621 RepID=A0A238F727_9BASI|nr:BQ2448_5285 [Microbotryum intermedium]
MQCSQTPLGQWLQQNGGQFHPKLVFKPGTSILFSSVCIVWPSHELPHRQPLNSKPPDSPSPLADEFGTSVYTTSTLTPGTSTVTCPFSLAITPASSRTALATCISSPALTDHQATCLYLVLHRIDPTARPQVVELLHQPYVDTLPTSFNTPLWWTQAEADLLRGTNLHGAIVDRSTSWKAEWSNLIDLLPETSKAQVTWDLYLWACSIISSRAFPSSLITGPSTPDSDPVLFPGVDTLNHAYATRITWSSDVQHPTHPSLSLILESQIEQSKQVFNSYGPKTNEEWLLGYGFVPEENPSDLLVLALSKPPPSVTTTTLLTTLETMGLDKHWRHSVPRSGVLPNDLMDQVRWITAGTWPNTEIGGMRLEEMNEGGRDVFLGFEVEFEAIHLLGSMVRSKMEIMMAYVNEEEEEEEEEKSWEDVKEERREMARRYRTGQLEILQAVDEHLEKLMEALEERAKKDGFDFASLMEDDEDGIEGEDEE